jgi:succinyl-diaminopimelate desuccinylase
VLFDLLAESRKIIGIDTSGYKGTRPLVRHLLPYCEAIGLKAELLGPRSGREADVNLVAHTVRKGSKNLCPGGLALVTHLDTVPGGESTYWTETGGDPWKATLKDDRLYGLGSADTKLDFLCKLLALEKVGVKNLKLPLALIGTFGEERSLGGARWLRDSGRMTPKFAAIGEPCELKAVVAHKGILYMRALFKTSVGGKRSSPFLTEHFRGKAAHGSMPHLGRNAIEKAIRWMRDRKGTEVAEIHGGTVHNVVPESCRVSVQEGEGPAPRANFLVKFIDYLEKARPI